VYPGERANGEADPERHDQQQKQQPFVPEGRRPDEIGGEVADERAQDRGHGADPHRLPKEAVVIGVKQKLLPVRQRQRARLDARGDEGEEGVGHHDDKRQHEEQQ
jgi:hypothetical protein